MSPCASATDAVTKSNRKSNNGLVNRFGEKRSLLKFQACVTGKLLSVIGRKIIDYQCSFNRGLFSACSVTFSGVRDHFNNQHCVHCSLVGLTPRSDRVTYEEILQIVQEKDRKLTDIRLEALTSQHQLHQLQDQIAQMQVDQSRTLLMEIA